MNFSLPERPSLRFLLPFLVPFLLLTGAVGQPADLAAQSAWYHSNEDFMDLEERPDGPGEGWSLKVERNRTDPHREVRTLYLEGERRGWEEVLHNPRGLPVEVRRFRDTLEVRPEPEPEPGPAPDPEPGPEPDAEEVFRLEISYRPGGTLRSIRRCAGEECILVRYAPPGMAGLESIRGPELTMGIRYGESARPEYVRRESPGEPLEEEWYEYDQGRLRSSRTVIGPREVVRQYTDGLLTLEETRRDRLLVERLRLEYRADGELLERIRETRNRVERDRYIPDVIEGVTRERFINGVLVEQEEITSPGERVVTRLQGGEILFRTWYTEDQPARREIYLEGEILRVEQVGE